MTLEKLDIYRVRNIQQASISPSPQINFIYGNNASGKSALLEAIFILGRAKSFRSTSIKPVIRSEETDLVISAKVRQANSSICSLGVQLNGQQTTIHINQEEINSRSELAYLLPIQLLHPKSYQLLDAGPQLRREFMDWGVFNMHSEFLHTWRTFKKTLQQRNSLLKMKQTKQIDVWNQELAQYGTIVAEYREQYLKQLEPLVRDIANEFTVIDTPDIKIISGWDSTKAYLECLQEDFEKDLRYGYTHSGPHRGDFILLCQNKVAKDYVSRGQLKLLTLALKLAQVKILKSSMGQNVCILIDDITAELDMDNRAKLLALLSQFKHQIFITTSEVSEFGDISLFEQHKVFHVEHGEIKLM
jgi:DNA replication and repair protein RecF